MTTLTRFVTSLMRSFSEDLLVFRYRRRILRKLDAGPQEAYEKAGIVQIRLPTVDFTPPSL